MSMQEDTLTIPGTIIFKALVGSHAYGTNIEGSDEDIKGVYVQDPRDIFVNGYKPQVELDKDTIYFELGRFLELCGSANPTMLELLFSPEHCILEEHTFFKDVRALRDRFLTKQCRHSFVGYAYSQIRKAGGLDKKMNWEQQRKERKTIEDFCFVQQGQGSIPLKTWLRLRGFEQRHCGLTRIEHMRNCYAIYHDDYETWSIKTGKSPKYKGIAGEDSNELRTDEVGRDTVPVGLLYFNLEAYGVHCKEYNEYKDWLEKRNVQRYVDIEDHGQKIDGKNLLHCVRLLDVGTEIALTGTLTVQRPNSDYLISIRKGKVDLQTILKECEEKIKLIPELYQASNLPDDINSVELGDMTRKLKEDWYDQRRTE